MRLGIFGFLGTRKLWLSFATACFRSGLTCSWRLQSEGKAKSSVGMLCELQGSVGGPQNLLSAKKICDAVPIFFKSQIPRQKVKTDLGFFVGQVEVSVRWLQS